MSVQAVGGKSVALKTLTARNIATTGCGAFFIDVEGEYTKLTKMLGGKVIKIAQGESAGINPFELEPDTKGNKQFLNILDKVAEIRALLATICRNYQGRTLNGTEITETEIVVNQLYAEKGITSDVNSLFEKKGGKLDNGKYAVGKIPKKMPTLSDFQKKLKERNKCNELAELLVPFLKGNSLGIFDCESKINSDAEIVSFDMSEIKDEFTKLYASFVILTWVWQKFVLKNKEKRKIIVCDEAWLFLKYQESAEFLVNVARRRSQVQCSIIHTVVNLLMNFYPVKNGKTIINICSTRYLFKQSPGSVDEVVDFFNLSEGTKNFLTTANPGECVISLNNSVTAIKFIITDFEKQFVFT
ncbi:MAG: DUF87 domain-containing protein [Clostridia bacterium]|nr:DUF87 domain-containing protein [Clostridia bacterium]